ncbi:hypothetical protein [Pectobacterium brasiliense]|uniref:hypothetical protein n=1 Tax=Pectobacterium brasiliense TaxID=180957 RepID=UPI0038739981
MMIVKKIAFGNKSEAFIEERLTGGVNVIYSNDNNKGKTLVIQGLMFSLGYDSIFPSSFYKKDKYFYSQVELNDETYEFLRKNNSIVVKTKTTFQHFNSIGEFKYYVDRNIFQLPRINKDDKSRVVDLNLLYEVFFVGQDNRSPSNLISRGVFNKADFKNMVFTLSGLPDPGFEDQNFSEIKDTLALKKTQLNEVNKKIKIIKSNPQVAEFILKSQDSVSLDNEISELGVMHSEMAELRKTRQREINRRSQLESLISELKSLNRELKEGRVECGACGSKKIIYTNDEIKFEISNTDVRNSILNSISNNIIQKNEQIDEYTIEINAIQNKLSRHLDEQNPALISIMLYRDEILEDRTYDENAHAIRKEIRELTTELNSSKTNSSNLKMERELLQSHLLSEMNSLLSAIDPKSNVVFDDIFTKRDATYSGSEEQEFYFCKIIALNNVLRHNFPIIIDSFRDGELSTDKEEIMLGYYTSLNKQVILSSTLKNEEYSSSKYISDNRINSIDYSYHQDSKILSTEYLEEFNEIILSFGIEID